MLNCTLTLSAASAMMCGLAQAQVRELSVAQQYGTSALPLWVRAQNKIFEKIAAALDLKNFKVKVSNQAICRQMAADLAFGPVNHTKLLIASMSDPDAPAALVSGISEIDRYFTPGSRNRRRSSLWRKQ